jgi:hypothetical protein
MQFVFGGAEMLFGFASGPAMSRLLPFLGFVRFPTSNNGLRVGTFRSLV